MTEQTTEAAPKERVDAFMGGVQATSLALRAILQRKVAIGVLDEALAKRIFEDTGTYLTACIEETAEEPKADDSNSVS